MENIDSLDMKISAIGSKNTSSSSESLSKNINSCTIYKTLKDTVHHVKYITISPSTAPKSKVKLKQVSIDKVYPSMGINHQETLLTTLFEPASTPHWASTIKNFLISTSSMYPPTVKTIRTKNTYREKRKFIV